MGKSESVASSATPVMGDLYQACVHFVVSDGAKETAWEQVAQFVEQHGLDGINEQFDVVEKQIKHDFSLPKLPSTWRSAKSIALRAKLLGVGLVDSEGKVQPKTKVGSALRRITTTTPPVTDAQAVARDMVQSLHDHLKTAHLTPSQLSMVARDVGLVHGYFSAGHYGPWEGSV